jgi:hypothetical protein
MPDADQSNTACHEYFITRIMTSKGKKVMTMSTYLDKSMEILMTVHP